MTNTIEKAPDKAEYVDIAFNKGIPVSVNGKDIEPVALVKELNRIGAVHAIGHVDMVENRLVGIKSRGVYETPGGTIFTQRIGSLSGLCSIGTQVI